jgi:hypothetical protein
MAKTTVPIELSSTPSIVDNGNATAITIDSSQNVGIGISSPTVPLQINHGSGSVGLYTLGSYNYQAKFESTDAEAAIVIEDSNSTTDGNRIGVITDAMTFTTAGSERMRIESSGVITIPTQQPFNFTYNGNTGSYNKTAVYTNQNNTSGNTGNGLFIEMGRITDSDAAETRKFVVGKRGGQITFLADDDGIKFNGDTASANALDDYEEGTWTVSLTASGSNPTIASISNTTGYYTKIGNVVYWTYYAGALNITNAGSGYAIMSLPFAGISGQYGLVNVTHTTCFNTNVDGGYQSSANAYCVFMLPQKDTTTAGWTTGNPVYLMVMGAYRVP